MSGFSSAHLCTKAFASRIFSTTTVAEPLRSQYETHQWPLCLCCRSSPREHSTFSPCTTLRQYLALAIIDFPSCLSPSNRYTYTATSHPAFWTVHLGVHRTGSERHRGDHTTELDTMPSTQTWVKAIVGLVPRARAKQNLVLTLSTVAQHYA